YRTCYRLLRCLDGGRCPSCRPISDKPDRNSSRGNKLMNHKVQQILSIFAVLAISLFLKAASLAQSSMEWKQCLGLEGPIVDTVIDGCTAIIQSGQEAHEKLATAFDNRGVAYRLKGDYERALQDYDQATRLNPDNANAYNNRGIIYRI